MEERAFAAGMRAAPNYNLGHIDMWSNIDTAYNGYNFRSRLEARWAIFFDYANIRYYYEPEAFELPSGRLYLPDFYLPDVYPRWTAGEPGIWVEVKPVYGHHVYLHELYDMTGIRVALLVGEPRIATSPRLPNTYFVEYEGYEYTEGYDMDMAFHKCPECGRIAYDYQNRNKCGYCRERGLEVCLDPCHPDLVRASEAARSWRFDAKSSDRQSPRRAQQWWRRR